MAIGDISDALSSGLSRRIQPTFCYYRQTNGWITISPRTPMERMKYINEGWTPLDEYGAFDMGVYTANHPFEGLFMFGGAKEMSSEQVIQTGLYFDPPLVPTCRQHLTQFHRSHTRECWIGATRVEFPQLDGVAKERLGPFPCEFCERKLPTTAAREQHQSVAHSRPLGNIQLGRTLGDTLAVALGKQAASPAATESEALHQRIAELEAEQVKTMKRREKMATARAKRGKAVPKVAVET